MPQTSLGGVTNSASKEFTKTKGIMVLVNFLKINYYQNQFVFYMQNKNI